MVMPPTQSWADNQSCRLTFKTQIKDGVFYVISLVFVVKMLHNELTPAFMTVCSLKIKLA